MLSLSVQLGYVVHLSLAGLLGYSTIRGDSNVSFPCLESLFICTCVFTQRSVFTLGTLPEGWNGISEEVFLSIPVCIGEKGITHLVSQKLNEAELAKVQQSAKTLKDIMDDIQL